MGAWAHFRSRHRAHILESRRFGRRRARRGFELKRGPQGEAAGAEHGRIVACRQLGARLVARFDDERRRILGGTCFLYR